MFKSMDRDIFVKEIKNLCEGSKRPDHVLYETGELPESWEEEYINLLKSNRNYWQNLENWPKGLFYCFYRVAFHHKYAYDQWAQKHTRNWDTERSLSNIRLFTEAFICGGPHDKWET